MNKKIIKETSHEIHEPTIITKTSEPEIVKVIKKLFEGYKGFTCQKIQAVGENQFYNIDVKYELPDGEANNLEDKRYLISTQMQEFRVDFFSDLSRYYPIINVNISGYKAEKNADSIEFYVTILLSNTNKRDWIDGEFQKPEQKAKDYLPKEKLKESKKISFLKEAMLAVGEIVKNKTTGKTFKIEKVNEEDNKYVLRRYEIRKGYPSQHFIPDTIPISHLDSQLTDSWERINDEDEDELKESFSIGGILQKIENTLNLQEAKKKSSIDRKYTHFAVDKKTGKIIDGWQYKDLDPEDIAYYVKNDLKDRDIPFKSVKISTKRSLLNKGINPYDKNNWGNNYEEKPEEIVEAENCELPDGSGFSTMTMKESSRSELKLKGKKPIMDSEELDTDSESELSHSEKMQLSKLAKLHIANKNKFDEIQAKIDELQSQQESYLTDEIEEKIISIIDKTKDKFYKTGKIIIQLEKEIKYKNFKNATKYKEVVEELKKVCRIEQKVVDTAIEAFTSKKEPEAYTDYNLTIRKESRQLKESLNAKKILANIRNFFFPIYKKYNEAVNDLEIAFNQL